MKGDVTFDEYLAETLQDPELAALWALHEPLRNLALNVWGLRETQGMTQQQLAEAAGMKQPRIADIERNAANPTLLTLSRIALALGTTVERLLATPDEAVMTGARVAVAARVETWSPHRRRALGLLDMAEAQPEPAAPQRRRKIA